MQISVEKTSELSRKMTVVVPEEMVQGKVISRLQSVGSSAKVDGFRPGKVPKSVIKKMYGARIREEVNGELIQTCYFKALKDEDLHPASTPDINIIKNDVGLKFTAVFEEYPKISLEGIENISVVKSVSKVDDSHIEEMIEKLREQQKIFKVSEQAVKQGDSITISFTGVCNGENFTEGTINDFNIEIGSNRMITGFEDELIGLSVGDKKSFEITFPEDYSNADLANQVASFDVEVTKVEALALPEINAEFIKVYGIENGSKEDFRADVKVNMERELKQALDTKLTNVVMNALFDNIAVTVPTALVDQEVESLMKAYKENLEKQNIAMDEKDVPAQKAFEERAYRRVALGLILSEIAQKNNLTADSENIRAIINEMAQSYEDPEQVVSWYYSDNKRLESIEQKVLEDVTVSWVIERITVTDEVVNFSDVLSHTEQK